MPSLVCPVVVRSLPSGKVLALQACGVGLNLAVADICVFAELCGYPSALEQAEARVHRMGQTAGSVFIYYLVAGEDDSPDAIMFNALASKADTLGRVLDAQAPASSVRDS